jgi:protein phosphatase
VVDRPECPRGGRELATAIEHANQAIIREGKSRKHLEGMGTTVVAARFSTRKQRVYIGHVGDSRVYRLREGSLHLLTKDHTLAQTGVVGPLSTNIRRALGVRPKVKVDIIVDIPLPDDIYLLCSDGLSKMVDDSQITRLLAGAKGDDLSRTATALIAAANAKGGRDNITVVIVRVREVTINGWKQSGPVAHA